MLFRLSFRLSFRRQTLLSVYGLFHSLPIYLTAFLFQSEGKTRRFIFTSLSSRRRQLQQGK